MNRSLIASAIAAAVLLPSAVFAQAAPGATPGFTAEKCYGIAKAGANDCASTGSNSCAGTARADADPAAWVYVPQGYCERIVGGSRAKA